MRDDSSPDRAEDRESVANPDTVADPIWAAPFPVMGTAGAAGHSPVLVAGSGAVAILPWTHRVKTDLADRLGSDCNPHAFRRHVDPGPDLHIHWDGPAEPVPGFDTSPDDGCLEEC